MPRNMSFSMTTKQFQSRSKTVTRRMGWKFLKPGDIVCGVEKAMGLQKGEKIKRLGYIKIVSIRTEPLQAITLSDCTKEGFPEKSPADFVKMICDHYGCNDLQPVQRIEFEHIEILPEG